MKEAFGWEDCERLILWKVRQFRKFPDWPDIRQTALIKGWQAWQQSGSSAVAMKAGWRGALDFLRSPQCDPRYRHYREDRDHNPVRVEMVSLQPDGTVWGSDGGKGGEDVTPGTLVSGDFTARVIERLEVERLYARMDPKDAEAVRLMMGGWTQVEVAKEWGVTSSTICWRVKRGLSAAREALGSASG